MQFSESWLRPMVDPKMTSDELSHLLTMSGLEVEEVGRCAALTNIQVGLVVETAKHPNADRLNVARSMSAPAPCSISLRRLNAPRPHAVRDGRRNPTPGADGKLFEIVSQLRGVESQGMLCSARELKLAEDHGGLLELPEDAGRPISATISN